MTLQQPYKRLKLKLQQFLQLKWKRPTILPTAVSAKQGLPFTRLVCQSQDDRIVAWVNISSLQTDKATGRELEKV
jgi:hypothetical protein